MLRSSALTDQEVATKLKPRVPPPSMPASWIASGLFLAFGDANPKMPNYDQLLVASIACDAAGAQPAMRVSLYLLESLQYFDFLFTNGAWYWLVSQPGQAPTGYYGPFQTSLQIPPPDLLVQSGASYGNSWPICGFETDGWVIPTANQPSVPAHGTWYSMMSGTGNLWRVLNLDNSNPVNVPFLGSSYLAYLPGFQATEPLNLMSLLTGSPLAGNPPSPMVSQRDIQTALANPLASAPCTMPQIQAVIPGINFPATQPTLPAWTDQTFIQGWTIGCDPIPYWTQVWYWWAQRRQRTAFVGYGLQAGTGTYRNRMDSVLYANYFTSPVYYAASENQWVPSCPIPCFPGVGTPQPDFPAADNGVVKGTITGNPDFGLSPSQTMLMIACALPRGPNPGGQDVTSVFWFWFTDDQKGVLFSEGNYIDTVVAHDLQVIDYAYFEQNASDHVKMNSFEDPCYVAECTLTLAKPHIARHARF